jgi:hypothetical protein
MENKTLDEVQCGQHIVAKDGQSYCDKCEQFVTRLAFCPKCSDALDKLAACGSVSFFCNTCNELKSKADINYKYFAPKETNKCIA